MQRFSVFGLQTHEKVNSFRVVNPSEFLKSNIDEITQLMEEESRGKGAGSETESVVSPGKFS